MRAAKAGFLVVVALAVLCRAQTPNGAAPQASNIPASVDAVYYGAVDVGSKGTKSSLFSFVPDEEGANPVSIFDKTVNTSLVSSMQDGKFSPQGIADATNAVKQVLAAMKAEAEKRKIAVKVYFVVGSSGVAEVTNKNVLYASVKAATGIDMDTVDAAHEGYYGMISSVPLSQRTSSMYIDIGSGNSKPGCLVGGLDFASFKSTEIPYGSVSGRNQALKTNPDNVDAGIEALMRVVSTQYENKSRDIPCLRNRARIYWSGGAAWATATYTHPEGELKGWVTITKQDLERFRASLVNGTWNQKRPVFVFPRNTPPALQNEIRTKAMKDYNNVQDVFVREDLLSGVSIMDAVLNSSNASATIHFARNGNFLYGYALDRFKENMPSGGN